MILPRSLLFIANTMNGKGSSLSFFGAFFGYNRTKNAFVTTLFFGNIMF